MEGNNQDEFEKYKFKLKNKCNKFFIRCQKIIVEKKKERTRKKSFTKWVNAEKKSKMKVQILNKLSKLNIKWISLKKNN